MNLQQLRYVYEVARQGLNVSEAAEVLFTSQPGVSKQIRQFEAELGVEVFVRHGKRLVDITEPGRHILTIAERMLRDMENLRRVGEDFKRESEGKLSIATTHTQARHVLPGVIEKFLERYPQVKLSIHQGNPRQVCEMVLSGEADIAIATEVFGEYDELVMLPCHQWNRCLIALPDHPLLHERPLSLEAIARYPIITYDDAFVGRSLVTRAFLGRGLKPNVVLTAADSDIIKTYVAMGLGVGIVARLAYDPLQDSALGMVDASHLFELSTTRVALRRNAYLRGYIYDFIERFAPQLNRRIIDIALTSPPQSRDYQV